MRAPHSARQALEVKHLKRWTLRNLLRADIFYRAVPWTTLDPEHASSSPGSQSDLRFTREFPVGRPAGRWSAAVAVQSRGSLIGSQQLSARRPDRCLRWPLLLLLNLGCLSVLSAQAGMVVCRAGCTGALGLLPVQRRHLLRAVSQCISSVSRFFRHASRACRAA